MKNAVTKKSTGSYYTCKSIADYIVKWAIDNSKAIILEPSFGDGIFLNSALSRFAELGNRHPDIIGIEMQEEPYNQYIERHEEVSGKLMDFMDFQTKPLISAVIGNPPYISLKKLPAVKREKALQVVRSYGVDMQSCGSLWMPFVIHATEMLAEHGKLGFVLPYEITYVRYAVDLWKYLANNYGKITICRVFRDFFPDVDVETIIFLADERGGSTNTVHYKVFETVSDLANDYTWQAFQIPIDEILHLKKPFERVLIPESVASLLACMRRDGKIRELIQDCKFRIGYVTGNKEFFHPNAEVIQKFRIDSKNLRKCLLNAKQITASTDIGIETAALSVDSSLFYPIALHDGEKEYISYGESQKVNQRYKCKVRNPWYLVPGLEIPDLVLTVFGNIPKLLINNGEFYISNSLLGGFLNVENCKELICRWYNSLTLLSIEITIHSLGGGTFVFIPGETDRLEIVSDFPREKIESVYTRIAEYARKNSMSDTYQYGDEIVLKEIYGISDKEIHEIRGALANLQNWRCPEKRRGAK